MRRYLFNSRKINNPNVVFDVIIVGGGLAGLYCALNLSEKLSCALITKGGFDDGSSWLAQGGIAAVTRESDCFENHISDTLTAGAGHCNPKAVEVLVKEGPEAINQMLEYGVPFDRDSSGNIIVTREGGHNCSRILHCGGDATGMLMTKRLGEVVLTRPNIKVFYNTNVIDILTDDNGVTGAVINDGTDNSVLYSRNVVISTGAIGQLYRYTTNPKGATGDGIAICRRAGAVTKDMEFVQFHPTALSVGEIDGRMFLISEAVRGEGAILQNQDGDPFMYNKHSLRDLAPRDIVTREILKELKRTSTDTAYLDVSCMTEDFFQKRFPTIYSRCKELGINVPHDRIPVHPTQHYHMGGVATDLHSRTSISGLYACGEVACTGVQGANRLASNSTLECLVFGKRAAQQINSDFRPNDAYNFKLPETNELSVSADDVQAQKDIEEMKELMSANVGALRRMADMENTLTRLSQICEMYDNANLNSPIQYYAANASLVSTIITQSAINRKESIGSHFIIE